MKKNYLAFLAALGLADNSTPAHIETAFTSDEAKFINALKANGFETMADAIENPTVDSAGNPTVINLKKEFAKIIAAVAAEVKAEAEGKIISFDLNGREMLLVTPKGKASMKPVSYEKEIIQVSSITVGGIKDSKGGVRCTLSCLNESNLEYELEVSSNYFKDNALFAGLPTQTVTRGGVEYTVPKIEDFLYLQLKVQRNTVGDTYTSNDPELIEAVRDEHGDDFINRIELLDGDVRESVTLSYRSEQTKFHSPSLSSETAFISLKIQRDEKLRARRDTLLLEQSAENANLIARQKALASADDERMARIEKYAAKFGVSFKEAAEMLDN